jgi:MATE family multidrug resistance protein
MGRLNNPAWLGAIALGATIFTLIYSGLGFLRMGTSGFTAQSRGKRDIGNSYVILSRSLLIALSLGFILILLQKPIAWLAFHFINSSSNVESFALEYFNVRIWAAPATLGLFALTGWLIGMQDAKTPMWISIIVNVVNIFFSILFVSKYHLNARGVALGTVIGQYTGLFLGSLVLLKHSRRIKLYWKRKKIFVWKEIANFMNVNKDILIRSLLLTGSFYYFNAASASLGDNILAVNSILLQFLWLFSHFIDGFAFAAEALTGKYIGAKNKIQLKSAVKLLFIWGILLSISVSLIYWMFSNQIINILTDQVALIELAKSYKIWIIILPIVSFSAFIWDGIYIGATEGKTMRNAMILSSLVIFIPCLHLFSTIWGNNGMWLAMALFMLFRGILLHLFYQKNVLSKSNIT